MSLATTSCARAGVLGRRGFALERRYGLGSTGGRCTQVGRWMGSLCSEVANWLWTPQLSVLSIVMGPHTKEQRTRMGWSCMELAAGRSEHTLNWFGLEPLVVLGIEVGGRMSTETASFLSQLAKARARQESALMRRRAEQAWRMRWGAILACATARAVATSLLCLGTSHGADGDTLPTYEVEGDHRSRPKDLNPKRPEPQKT